MINKERLENMSPIGFDLNGDVLLKSEEYHWLMEQDERVEELERKLSINTNNMKQLQKQNVRYKQALEYIQRAIYTQHCTKNHKWNTEFEKGQISGLIQASNIVDKAIRKVEEETE